MAMKKWQVKKLNKELAKELAYECDVDPIVALIASARGYTDPTSLEEFLSDEPCFESPYMLADINKAADIINRAIEANKKIAVFGDYDCDGITATALMISYLNGRKADAVYYIPNRFDEGYGMNIAAVEKLKTLGVELLITVDNGIMCHKEIEHAKNLGMTVVVTDHHLVGDTLPLADAVVDPHRLDCPSEFKEICGAEVAFKLICAIENSEPEELLPYFADLLCVAVLADVMPLTLENRSIIKYGINKLKTAPLTGLSAILNVAGISNDGINAGRVAFGIAPRINAAGRMGDPSRAVQLLLSDNMLEALEIANDIDSDNANRQRTEKEIFDAAEEKIEQTEIKYDRVIVVEGENWHTGVLGIVASRLTEKYGSPAIVLSVNGDKAEGSARSIEGFSIYDGLKNSADFLLKFGGHKLAAGLSLETEKIPEFRKAINDYAVNEPYVAPEIKLDCKLNPSALNLDLAEALKDLEPFGNANPTPLFGLYGVTLSRITPIGNGKHLRLIFTKNDNSFQAVLFNCIKEKLAFGVGDILDAAVTVDTNIYGGEVNLSVQIKALRISQTDDQKLFYGIDNLKRFLSGRKFDKSVLLPTREEVGVIYKYILSGSVLADRIKYVYINTIGFAKTEIALITLTELGLIMIDKIGYYKGTGLKTKTELTNSPTYKKLLEGSETV